MSVKRRIIKIDEQKCNGCGKCAEACHEGAIVMVDGKARLVSDIYCDGLGDCIGECPVDAISFETRIAEPYDEEAVQKRMEEMGAKASGSRCPGSMAKKIERENTSVADFCETSKKENHPTKLQNWPVQLKLIPENAPYLDGAHLVIAADCTAFAHGGFHSEFLRGDGKVCLIGCPKLDDKDYYRQKLARILDFNQISSVTVIYMEVPCCGSMVRLVQDAIDEAGKDMDLKLVKVGINGEVREEEKVLYRFREKIK